MDSEGIEVVRWLGYVFVGSGRTTWLHSDIVRSDSVPFTLAKAIGGHISAWFGRDWEGKWMDARLLQCSCAHTARADI